MAAAPWGTCAQGWVGAAGMWLGSDRWLPGPSALASCFCNSRLALRWHQGRLGLSVSPGHPAGLSVSLGSLPDRRPLQSRPGTPCGPGGGHFLSGLPRGLVLVLGSWLQGLSTASAEVDGPELLRVQCV